MIRSQQQRRRSCRRPRPHSQLQRGRTALLLPPCPLPAVHAAWCRLLCASQSTRGCRRCRRVISLPRSARELAAPALGSQAVKLTMARPLCSLLQAALVCTIQLPLQQLDQQLQLRVAWAQRLQPVQMPTTSVSAIAAAMRKRTPSSRQLPLELASLCRGAGSWVFCSWWVGALTPALLTASAMMLHSQLLRVGSTQQQLLSAM